MGTNENPHQWDKKKQQRANDFLGEKTEKVKEGTPKKKQGGKTSSIQL